MSVVSSASGCHHQRHHGSQGAHNNARGHTTGVGTRLSCGLSVQTHEWTIFGWDTLQCNDNRRTNRANESISLTTFGDDVGNAPTPYRHRWCSALSSDFSNPTGRQCKRARCRCGSGTHPPRARARRFPRQVERAFGKLRKCQQPHRCCVSWRP